MSGNENRIGRAILNGWGIQGFRKAVDSSGRHAVWIQKPDTEVWYVEKTDGSEKDWIGSLLDEAGVPK